VTGQAARPLDGSQGNPEALKIHLDTHGMRARRCVAGPMRPGRNTRPDELAQARVQPVVLCEGLLDPVASRESDDPHPAPPHQLR